jgi:hypothetical protein
VWCNSATWQKQLPEPSSNTVTIPSHVWEKNMKHNFYCTAASLKHDQTFNWVSQGIHQDAISICNYSVFNVDEAIWAPGPVTRTILKTKSAAPPGIKPWTVQSIASHYNYTTHTATNLAKFKWNRDNLFHHHISECWLASPHFTHCYKTCHTLPSIFKWSLPPALLPKYPALKQVHQPIS